MPKYTDKTNISDKDINFYIVTSVKGGCGKSSVSFDLAYRKKDACIIDMDILGSTWALLSPMKGQKFIKDIHTTNDIISKLIWKKDINGKKISIIMNSNETKEKFNYLNQIYNANTPEIETGIFKNIIIHLIEYLINNGYKNLIFDMPPSFDLYSGPLFNYLCKYGTKIETELPLKLNFILVSPVTRIGVNSIYDWLYGYFYYPKNFSYVTDIKKINIEVFFVDLFNIGALGLNLIDTLKEAIDNKIVGFNTPVLSDKNIKNYLVDFSFSWYRIANQEIPIEDFQPFITNTLDKKDEYEQDV